jgi:hypothetical protein
VNAWEGWEEEAMAVGGKEGLVEVGWEGEG